MIWPGVGLVGVIGGDDEPTDDAGVLMSDATSERLEADEAPEASEEEDEGLGEED